MGALFSRINLPTFAAVIVFIAVDKKLGITNKLLSMLGMGPTA